MLQILLLHRVDLLSKTPSVYSPVRLVAVRASRSTPGSLEFQVSMGSDPTELATPGVMALVAKYFWQSLSVSPGDVWVDFDPSGSNEPLPVALRNTDLGDVFLETDLTLKVFVSSLMHPDTESGRQFWRALRSETIDKLGTTDMPQSWRYRVTIQCDAAEVFEAPENPIWNDCHAPDGKLHEIFTWMSEPETLSAAVTKLSFAAHVEVVASEAFEQASESSRFSNAGELAFNSRAIHEEVALNVFRQTILPTLNWELNNGRVFGKARQVFTCIALSGWLKHCERRAAYLSDPVLSLINSNQPQSINLSSDSKLNHPDYGAARELSSALNARSILPPKWLHQDSSSIAGFDFYATYLDLFRNGAFRLIRSERDEGASRVTSRLYILGRVVVGVPDNGQTSVRPTVQVGLNESLFSESFHVFHVRLNKNAP